MILWWVDLEVFKAILGRVHVWEFFAVHIFLSVVLRKASKLLILDRIDIFKR